MIPLSFYILHNLLNAFNLEFRRWIVYFVAFISFVLIIAGIFQLLFRIKTRVLKNVLTSILIIALAISCPYMVALTGFSYTPEHVVTKDGIRLVAYVDGFMHTSVDYYDYVNFMICGSQLQLYEDYGDGGFDPIRNSQGLTYNVQDYIWYDDAGNPIK